MSKITHLATTASTNDWLATRAASLPDLAWVRAETQTGGRGRRGRAWQSLPGNLFASVLVHPQAGDGPAQQLSFVAALALDRALCGFVPAARMALKWPNDVLLDGVKCAGILLEGGSDVTIIGFGVNLAGHPEGTERPATSLPAAGFAAPDPAAFAEALAHHFAAAREQWRNFGFAPVRADWLARAAGPGQRLEARLGHATLTGTFADLDHDGALLLRLDDGSVRAIHAGEVFAL